MKHLASIITLCFVISCNNVENIKKNNYSIIEIIENNTTPSVDISKYKLVIDSDVDHTEDAKKILEVKRQWPLAMQSLKASEFDSILSKKFTFKGLDGFYNRTEYIANRTKPDNWKIEFVKYDEMCLQFIGDQAILSYKNKIVNVNSVSQEKEIEYISWVDVFTQEDKKWKILTSHAIDYRLEKQ